MRSFFRTAFLSALLTPAFATYGQADPPYFVSLYGLVANCTSGGQVTFTTLPGTHPDTTFTADLFADCTAFTIVPMQSMNGGFEVNTPCGGAQVSGIVYYAVDSLSPDSTMVPFHLDCWSALPDCEGAIGGPAQPGTPCDDGDADTYLDAWGADCICAGQLCTPLPETLSLSGGSAVTLCSNDSTFFQSVTGITPDMGPVHYLWTGAGLWATDTLPSVNVYQPGIYHVTVSNPCSTAEADFVLAWTQAPDAGMSAIITVCSTSDPFNMFAELNGTPEAGGIWTGPNGMPAGAIFDPATMPGGVYLYTVPGVAPCPNAAATLTVIIDDNQVWYEDADGDGLGDPAVTMTGCTQPAGFVSNANDSCPGIFGTVGSYCDDGDPSTVNDMIGADCICTGTSLADCEACFTVVSSAPWTADFLNCSSGGSQAYSYSWWMPDGSFSGNVDEGWTFNSPGMYVICLTVNTADGCTDVACDSVSVDMNGTVAPITGSTDCLGIPNGPNQPGTTCTTDEGDPGTWDWNCDCIALPDTSGCEACFTVDEAAPFTGFFTSCTTGDAPPYLTAWAFTPTDTIFGDSLTYLFPGPGNYTVCMGAMGTDLSWCYTCNTVYVDNNGAINPSGPVPCYANFWTIQAYDSTGQGAVVPVPNEVLVLNLSGGGSGAYQFLWDFGDGSSSTEAFPSHEYDGPGPYLLCLTLTDSEGCTDAYCDSVSIDENGMLNGMAPTGHPQNSQVRASGFTLNVIQGTSTGIAEVPALSGLELWPNPAQDALNVRFEHRLASDISITVVDATGRTVLAEGSRFPMGSNTLQLRTDALESGLYLLRVSDGSSTISKRFLKMH